MSPTLASSFSTAALTGEALDAADIERSGQQSPGISRILRMSWTVRDPNCSDVLSEEAESSRMKEQLHEREHRNRREVAQGEAELGKAPKKCSGNGSFLRIPVLKEWDGPRVDKEFVPEIRGITGKQGMS